MVLTYLQVPFKYEQLTQQLQTRPYGTIFYNLRHLESLGLFTIIDEGSIEQLQNYLAQGLPVIAAVDTGQLTSYWQEQTDHAVVVVGLVEDRVYLNDPEFETAPQLVSRDEFELAWLEKGYRFAVIGLAEIT
jgi:ABC-type bacteriocin/lantibiotic exporter with double-glycine peptidase domain